MFLDIVRDAAAEAWESEIRRVAGASALKGVNGGFADMPWRCEIRLSDAERDDVAHGLNDFKKIPNSRAGDSLDVFGDGDTHGVTDRRSDETSKWWKVPFSLYVLSRK